MGAMTGLLLLLWAGVTVGSVLDLQKRIIGGVDCPDGERDYHVVLRGRKGSSSYLCGGSLISDQWILTAAHCWLDNTWTLKAHLGRPPAAVGVEITKHKQFSNAYGKHDIMLLKLPVPTNITPVDLPDCTIPPNIGDSVEIAGHASTTLTVDRIRVRGESVILQCVDITVFDCDELRKCLKTNDPQFLLSKQHENWLCYKEKNKDTAPGDSGGGVVFNNRIHGVHSFTGNETHACVEAAASMNVCDIQYLNWIYTETGILKP